MPDLRASRSIRLAGACIVAVAVMTSATAALAAKPPPKPPTLKVSAVVSGFDVTVNYQVNLPSTAIADALCVWNEGRFQLIQPNCDPTPDQGSGTKLSKYSFHFSTRTAQLYGFNVDVTLTNGSHLTSGTTFTVLAGPAVGFKVTGLVHVEPVCRAGPDCVNFPAPDYPRQIARITAVDAFNNTATSYAGTVTFVHGATGFDLADMTLTNGVGFVPVVFPLLGYLDPSFETKCPPSTPVTHVALMVVDTVDPSIMGCQSVPGGTLSIIFPEGFLTTTVSVCPTGCFSEPTGTITIDTNFIAPFITAPVAGDNTLVIAGGTTAGEYFTQAVTISGFTISGGSINISPACTQCTSAMNYLADESTLTIGYTITLNEDGFAVVGQFPDPFTQVLTPYQLSTTTFGVGGPTCYADSIYSQLLQLCSGPLL